MRTAIAKARLSKTAKKILGDPVCKHRLVDAVLAAQSNGAASFQFGTRTIHVTTQPGLRSRDSRSPR